MLHEQTVKGINLVGRQSCPVDSIAQPGVDLKDNFYFKGKIWI